jgi:hypothetical protein
MSVGGKVLETIVLSDRVWVNTIDDGHECAIYIMRTPESRSISEGDTVWWQGKHAFWTPKGRPFRDRELLRIGFSGVRRPSPETPTHE